MGGAKGPRTRSCVFTWNNPEDVAMIIEALKAWQTITYGVVGEEVGEECGTPHLQGYLEFKAQVSWSTINERLNRSHSEARRGKPEEAAAYCKKGKQPKAEWLAEGVEGPNYGAEAVVYEWGEITQQGKRNDLSPACEMIREGKRLREVAEEHPEIFVKYHKGLIALQSILIKPRNEVPEVIVYHGSTGAGKSKIAREWLGDDKYVWHPQQAMWFDGYAGEKACLFEEFRGQIPFGMLLSLTDRYDCKIQYKGGMCEFAATRIAFTSPLHPKQWYKQSDLEEHDKIEQLLRRISTIIDMDEQRAKRRRLDEEAVDKAKILGLTYI